MGWPGVPVTAPKSGEPTPTIPEPENGGIERSEYELHKRVLAWSGVQRPTEAPLRHDDVPDSPRTFGCTVTYDGTEAPIKIRITDVTKGIGMALFEWEVVEQKAVLTKEGVFAAFWRQGKRAGYTDMRCDDRHPRQGDGVGGPDPLLLLLQVEEGAPPPRACHRRRARSALLPERQGRREAGEGRGVVGSAARTARAERLDADLATTAFINWPGLDDRPAVRAGLRRCGTS